MVGLAVHQNVWAQCLVQLRDNRFGGSLDPHKFRLSIWLTREIVGLEACQTHIYLGSTLG
jgi:hypothetical protein